MDASHLVIDAVQEARNHREEGGSEGLDVIHEQRDVPLVEPHPRSMAEHGHLGNIKTDRWEGTDSIRMGE